MVAMLAALAQPRHWTPRPAAARLPLWPAPASSQPRPLAAATGGRERLGDWHCYCALALRLHEGPLERLSAASLQLQLQSEAALLQGTASHEEGTPKLHLAS